MNLGKPTRLIIVMGVSGSGKSTVARELAAKLSYDFVEADDFHSEQAKKRMSRGLPLTDDMRLPWVDRIKESLEQSISEHRSSVLAFSGLRKSHREILQGLPTITVTLFLNADQELIAQRLEEREQHFMSPSLLSSQFETLESPIGEQDTYEVSAADVLPSVVSNCLAHVFRN